MDTLVLDNAMIPVTFINSHRAIKMMYAQRATPVKFDSDELLCSERLNIFVPRVIMLNRPFVKKFRRRIPFSRSAVMIRDSINGKPQCQYCLKILTKKEATFDHIIPKCKGGISSFTNLVVSCMKCNKKKDSQTQIEANMFVFREPKEPSIHDKRFNYKLSVTNVRTEWSDWIDYINIC